MAKTKKQAVAPAAGNADPFWAGVSANEVVAALIVGAVIFMRPWYDGMTFPDNNAYFIFAILAAAVFWIVRPLLGRSGWPFTTPVYLLLAYLAVAAITTWTGVQYARSYRALMLLSANVVLFTLMANGLRTRKAVGIVLAFFVLTSLAEVLYSFMHVNWLMPQTRQLLMNDPTLLRQYFGTDQMTPAIQHRLESNRSTGTLLFANAFAAWLILGIPLAIGLVGYALTRFRALSRAPRPPVPSEANLLAAAAAALVVFSVLFAAIATHYSFYFYFAYQNQQWTNYLARWGFYCLVVPAIFAAAAYGIARAYGGLACWFASLAAVCGPFALFQIVALGQTYSRGAMLGLMAAAALGALLMWKRGRGIGWLDRRWAAPVAAAGMLIALGAVVTQFDAAAQADTPAPALELDSTGRNVALQDLMNPATAFLRLSYWAAGVNMAMDHPLFGVGLGNFGVTYPQYQLIGGGEVQQAHNDYLQVLCESGIFGLIAFAAFWGYFILWGLRRIAAEQDTADRWLLCGVYCSVVAFLLHALVDFNFVNPSLSTPAFMLAGAFYALAHRAQPDAPVVSNTRSRVLAAVALVLVALTAYGQLPVTRQYLFIGDKGMRDRRFDAARICMVWSRNPDEAKKTNSLIRDMIMAEFFPDRAERERFGVIWVPRNDGTTKGRPLRTDEPLEPYMGTAMFQVRDFETFRRLTDEKIDYWIEQAKIADTMFPHDASVSEHIYLWHELLISAQPDPAEMLVLTDLALSWAQVCEARSPYQTAYQELMGRALWRRGMKTPGMDAVPYLDSAIEHYKMAAEMYPVRDLFWDEYSQKCTLLADHYKSLGLDDKVQSLTAESARAKQFAIDLRDAWAQTQPV